VFIEEANKKKIHRSALKCLWFPPAGLQTGRWPPRKRGRFSVSVLARNRIRPILFPHELSNCPLGQAQAAPKSISEGLHLPARRTDETVAGLPENHFPVKKTNRGKALGSAGAPRALRGRTRVQISDSGAECGNSGTMRSAAPIFGRKDARP